MARRLGASWTKSTQSAMAEACVEIAAHGSIVQMRDSKGITAGALAFPADCWRAFVAGVHDGEFDLPSRT